MVRRPLLLTGFFAVCLLALGGCSGTPVNSNPGTLTVTTTTLASGSTSGSIARASAAGMRTATNRCQARRGFETRVRIDFRTLAGK